MKYSNVANRDQLSNCLYPRGIIPITRITRDAFCFDKKIKGETLCIRLVINY
jgi:hypothetical protein